MNFKTNYQVDEAPVTNIERMLPAGLGMFGPLRQAARNVVAKVPKDQAARLAWGAAAQVAAPTLGAGYLLSRANDMPKVQGATLPKLLTPLAPTPISKSGEGDCVPQTPDLEQQADFFNEIGKQYSLPSESVECNTPIPTNGGPANSQLKEEKYVLPTQQCESTPTSANSSEDKDEHDLQMEMEKFFNKITKQCESTKTETDHEFFAEIVKQATNETCNNKRDLEEDKQESSESPRGYATSFLLGGKDKMAKSSLEIRSMITDYVRSMSEYFHLLRKHAVVRGELTRQQLAELLKHAELLIHKIAQITNKMTEAFGEVFRTTLKKPQ